MSRRSRYRVRCRHSPTASRIRPLSATPPCYDKAAAKIPHLPSTSQHITAQTVLEVQKRDSTVPGTDQRVHETWDASLDWKIRDHRWDAPARRLNGRLEHVHLFPWNREFDWQASQGNICLEFWGI